MMEHTAGVRSTAGLWRPMGKGRATSTRPIRLFPTMSPALRTEPGILGVPLMCWSGESLSSGCLSLASERGCPGLTVGRSVTLGGKTDLGSNPDSATSYAVTQTLALLPGDMVRRLRARDRVGATAILGMCWGGCGWRGCRGGLLGRAVTGQAGPTRIWEERGSRGRTQPNSWLGPEINGCCPNPCN